MIRGGRVHALADGRAHLSFADVRYFAKEVLGHRVLLNYDGQAENIDVLGLSGRLVETIPEEA
jgi:MoxR-like ATPase